MSIDLKCYRCKTWPCACADGITLIHGDCREVLPQVPPVDLVLTDPPYGVTQQNWDSTEAVREIICGATLAVFTTGERLLSDLITAAPSLYRHCWVWNRVNKFTDFLNATQRPMRAHELVAVFSLVHDYIFAPVIRPGSYITRRTQAGIANGSYGAFGIDQPIGVIKDGLHPSTIISIPGCKTNTQLHPTEKPVELFDYLARSYPAAMTLDPFAGSGTTLVAAKQLGRKAIGIEIEERYCEIAANRLRQEVLPFTD